MDWAQKKTEEKLRRQAEKNGKTWENKNQKRAWAPMTRAKLLAFVGTIILLGFCKYSGAIEDFWSTKTENVSVAAPQMTVAFTQTGWAQCWRFLHFADNAADHGEDKIYKIRKLLNLFGEACADNYRPGQMLTIDEMMVPFRGRSRIKQYMPLKPIKRGFKIFAITCSTTAYLLGFEVYTGGGADSTTEVQGGAADDAAAAAAVDDDVDQSTFEVVMRLLAPFRARGHIVYLDRFFTSLALFMHMLKEGIYAIGTATAIRLRSAGIVVADTVAKGCPRGTTFSKNLDDIITCVRWKDTKLVYFLSTARTALRADTLRRPKKGAVRELVISTIIEQLYNMFMGGVDRCAPPTPSPCVPPPFGMPYLEYASAQMTRADVGADDVRANRRLPLRSPAHTEMISFKAPTDPRFAPTGGTYHCSCGLSTPPWSKHLSSTSSLGHPRSTPSPTLSSGSSSSSSSSATSRSASRLAASSRRRPLRCWRLGICRALRSGSTRKHVRHNRRKAARCV